MSAGIVTPELKTVLCPIWATSKTCKQIFGINENFVSQLASDGEIRRKKTGPSKQAAVLYNVADINEWFNN